MRALDEPAVGLKVLLPSDRWRLLKRTALRAPHGTGSRETPLWRRNGCRMFYPVLYHRKPLQAGPARMSELVLVCHSTAPLSNLQNMENARKRCFVFELFWIKTCCAPAHCSFKNSPPLKYLIDNAMFNQIIGKQVICKVAVKTLA